MIESKTTVEYRLGGATFRKFDNIPLKLFDTVRYLTRYQSKPQLMVNLEETIRLANLYLAKDTKYFNKHQLSQMEMLRDEMTQELEKASLLP